MRVMTKTFCVSSANSKLSDVLRITRYCDASPRFQGTLSTSPL
jgi:hypothetical protein